MHVGNNDNRLIGERRRELWFAAACLLMGALAAFGAWREIMHHDGIVLFIAPAMTMPVLAWRAISKKAP